MKKIGLFLGVDPSAGGMYQYNLAVLDALSGLPRDAYGVAAFAAYPSWSAMLSAHGIPMVLIRNGRVRRAFWKTLRLLRLPTGPARWLSRFVDPLARKFLQQRCDLWIFPSLDPLAFQVPVRSLAAVHDLMHRYESRFPEVSGAGAFRLREWSYRNICAWAEGVLVDSNVGKEQVRKNYRMPEERIHVLPYAAPAYLAGTSASIDVTVKYGLPKKYLFYPANFWEHKNHRNLIEAISMLKAKLPDLSLVLVGSRKNGYEAAMRQIEQKGLGDSVVVLGYVPDGEMAALYRHARALVMPTFFGPTNIPPLEAFAVGCPVAISGIYGMPEQVGDAALLFDPASVDDIAGCIRRLWTDDDLCAALVDRGRKRAASWGRQQFSDHLKGIIERII